MRKENLDRKKNVRFTEKNNVTVQNQPPKCYAFRRCGVFAK